MNLGYKKINKARHGYVNKHFVFTIDAKQGFYLNDPKGGND